METDPFSRANNHKRTLPVNKNLVVIYKDPIARDFTFYIESGSQVNKAIIALHPYMT